MKSKEVTCKRCGRSWTPYKGASPTWCRYCHSPYWNKEKQGKTIKEKQEAVAGEIQGIINSLSGDPSFNTLSSLVLNANVSYPDELPKNPLADLELARTAIEQLANETRERIANTKKCEVERDRLAGEIMQLAQDTDQAALIQATKTILDMLMPLPAIPLIIQKLEELKSKTEKATRGAREIRAKERAQLAMQPKLAGLNEA